MSQQFSFSIQDTEVFKQTVEKFQQELISRWDEVSDQWSNLEATWYDQEYDKFAPFYERIADLYEEVSRDLSSHKDFLKRQIDSSDKLKNLVLHLHGFSPSPFHPESNSSSKSEQRNKEHNKRSKRQKIKQQLEYFKAVLGLASLLVPTPHQILSCDFADSSEVVICSYQEVSLPDIVTGGEPEDNLTEAYLKDKEEKKQKRERKDEVSTYINNKYPKVSRIYDPPK